jgi:hypothetical protein
MVVSSGPESSETLNNLSSELYDFMDNTFADADEKNARQKHPGLRMLIS